MLHRNFCGIGMIHTGILLNRTPGLGALPSTDTAVVSTGPGRERSVTRRPSFRQLKLLSLYIAYDRVWRVFWTRRPVDGHGRRKRSRKARRNGSATRRTEPVEPARRILSLATGNWNVYLYVPGASHLLFRSDILRAKYLGYAGI
ncbi:hypothetical protein DFH09DRAFT_1079658 [Mycena vulgaris]|nr:hypothetical protein DFH09DRAFT_1079658 [Mycena vulgaris]